MKIFIEYDIFSTAETGNFSPIEYIEGGIRIQVDDSVITKYEDDKDDSGFRYDNLYYLILGLLTIIPLNILKNKPAICRFIDSEEAFFFSPAGDKTIVKFRHLGDPVGTVQYEEGGTWKTTTVEALNMRYPDYPEGTAVPTTDLIRALTDVGEKFVEYLGLNTDFHSYELNEIKRALEDAKESVRT